MTTYMLVIKTPREEVETVTDTDLAALLIFRDKLNGDHPDCKGSLVSTYGEAIVACQTESYPFTVDWNNVEDSERPEYVNNQDGDS